MPGGGHPSAILGKLALSAAARFAVILIAGFVGAASLGKLVPHLDWIARNYGVALGLAGFALS